MRIRNRPTKKTYSRHNLQLKKEYFEYICKCARENKTNREIVNDLQERYGSECIAKNTILNWIVALKKKNRKHARERLGPQWMTYWDELKRPDDSKKSKKLKITIEPSLKRACLEFICECVKQKKKKRGIRKTLEERHG